MVEAWYEGYKEKIKRVWPKRMPFGLDFAGPYLTASIGIGIFYEFIIVVLICLLCAIFQNYYAWYGFYIGFVFHLLTPHLTDVIKFKGYTPGIITGAIVFIPSIWMLYQTATILHYGVLEIVLSAVVMQGLLSFIVFRNLHQSMVSWSKRLYQYSKAETKE